MPRSKVDYEILNIRLPKALKNWYRQRAARMNVPISYYVLQVLYEGCEQREGFDPFDPKNEYRVFERLEGHMDEVELRTV